MSASPDDGRRPLLNEMEQATKGHVESAKAKLDIDKGETAASTPSELTLSLSPSQGQQRIYLIRIVQDAHKYIYLIY